MSLTITPDAAQLLAQVVEGNLAAAAQEIEKLSLSGAAIIDRPLVENMVVDQGCFNAFDLLEYALAGKSVQALRILRYLQQEGAEPLMILGAFTHELRTLTKLAKHHRQGASVASLMTQFHIRFNRQEAVRAFLTRHTEKSCWALMLRAGEIDRQVKGA